MNLRLRLLRHVPLNLLTRSSTTKVMSSSASLNQLPPQLRQLIAKVDAQPGHTETDQTTVKEWIGRIVGGEIIKRDSLEVCWVLTAFYV
jgi:hypothetical protein